MLDFFNISESFGTNNLKKLKQKKLKSGFVTLLEINQIFQNRIYFCTSWVTFRGLFFRIFTKIKKKNHKTHGNRKLTKCAWDVQISGTSAYK